MVGYYINFGLRCRPENTKSLLEGTVVDGCIDWDDSRISAIDFSALDEKVRKRCILSEPAGIWFKGGRIFYPASETEN